MGSRCCGRKVVFWIVEIPLDTELSREWKPHSYQPSSGCLCSLWSLSSQMCRVWRGLGSLVTPLLWLCLPVRLRVFQQRWLLRIPVTNTSASPKCISCPWGDGQLFRQRVLPWEWDEWPGGPQQHQLYHSSTWSCRHTAWQYPAQPTHRSVRCSPAWSCPSVFLVSSGELANFMFLEVFSWRHFMRKQAANIHRNDIWQAVFFKSVGKAGLVFWGCCGTASAKWCKARWCGPRQDIHLSWHSLAVNPLRSH